MSQNSIHGKDYTVRPTSDGIGSRPSVVGIPERKTSYYDGNPWSSMTLRQEAPDMIRPRPLPGPSPTNPTPTK